MSQGGASVSTTILEIHFHRRKEGTEREDGEGESVAAER
jgi:hypothetical protein